MFIREKTLDDALRNVIQKLLRSKIHISPTRKEAKELHGVLLEITDPRARLSRTEKKGTLFSCLGELLWCLAKTNDLGYISYYIKKYKEDSEDKLTIYGGYGPRLFNMRNSREAAGIDQISNVCELLRQKPFSRRAVVQLFDAIDIARHHIEIPCTCTLQFMIRKQRLYMFTSMRSNDAFIGLPHDIFVFTMLQEILARSLNVELGTYKHFVGSLHLYEIDKESACQYLEEGWQPTKSVSMPAMPIEDPWSAISWLLEVETNIRNGQDLGIPVKGIHQYWLDLARLLQIFKYAKEKNSSAITRVRKLMHYPVYDTYIRKRQAAKPTLNNAPEQMSLPTIEPIVPSTSTPKNTKKKN